MYDVTLGRFLQRDPLGYAAGMSLYEYVNGNPTAAVDPLGLKANEFKAVATAYFHPVIDIPGLGGDKDIATITWRWPFECTRSEARNQRRPVGVTALEEVDATNDTGQNVDVNVKVLGVGWRQAFVVRQDGTYRQEAEAGTACMLVDVSATVDMSIEFSASLTKKIGKKVEVPIDVKGKVSATTASIEATFKVCCCCGVKKVGKANLRFVSYSVVRFGEPKIKVGGLAGAGEIRFRSGNATLGECNATTDQPWFGDAAKGAPTEQPPMKK